VLPGQQAKPRVVIALYDEWDYRLTFEDRKNGATFPEIERFRAESVSTTHAHPPARETIFAVPALLTGKMVSDVRLVDLAQMDLDFEGTKAWIPFTDADTLFRDVREAGINAAVAGWYLPYCRLFGKYLTSCEWRPAEQKPNSIARDFQSNLIEQPRALFEWKLDSASEIKYFSLFGQPLATRRRVASFLELSRTALEKAVDPEVRLLYLHVPAPHSPYFYNSQTRSLDFHSTAVSGYLQNLGLVDRHLGELRRKMEGAGMWDKTTVILLADHFFRTAEEIDGKIDYRVPLLVKMAGSNVPLQFDAPVNTVLLKGMVMSILRGEVSTASDALAYISHQATLQPDEWRTRAFPFVN
jgi:arylsulfatase A-like enzyme